MSSTDITSTLRLIQKDFALEPDSMPEGISTKDELIQKLIPIINYLLDKDMQRLLHVLYRIDISEAKVKATLTLEDPANIAPSLSKLIVEREFQKVLTRRKYSS